ncbi:VanW family protein [bacterium]|nr:VanW family protein [bacterium]MDY3022831.1 VanW family protein [Oliverpabstia sp.]
MKVKSIFAVATVGIAVLCAAPVRAQEDFGTVRQEQKILDNIYLENVDLSGLTVDEAMQAVERRVEETTGYRIILHMDDQSVGVTAKELGVSGNNRDTVENAAQIGQIGNVIKRYKVKKDLENTPIHLEMNYQVAEEALREALETYCVPLNREVSNYSLVRDNGQFQIINGQRGVVLKEEESVQLLETYLTEIWKDGIGDVELEVELTEPRGSKEELARVKNVLGQGSTDYSSSSAARATNIRNGTQKLNGKVLYPGESFSVCDAMVPFTEENGYELAGSYANGAVVESFGGGICQVSSTLYLAVLRSELQVTERHNHSMIVNYVKPSMDAAIAEGAKDFKFVNNLDAPIYIEGYAAGGTVSFVIYGEEYRPEGRTVSYESETLETIQPTTELTADPEKNLGSIEQTQTSHTGYRAKLWKVVTENGQENREEVNTSTYQMAPNKYKVGVKTDNAEAASAMYSAIATNDLNQVYVVLNQYS